MNTVYGVIETSTLHGYLERLNKRVFKILPMIEEGCTTVDVYIDSLSREIFGNSMIFYGDELLTIVGTLKGLDFNNHKRLKSDILKTCNIIDKMKKRVE